MTASAATSHRASYQAVSHHQAVHQAFWARPAEEVLAEVQSTRLGLGTAEAARRLACHGRNQIAEPRGRSTVRIFLGQFQSPLVLLLVFAAMISAVVGEWLDTTVIAAIMLASAGVGFWREQGAQRTLDRLRAHVAIHTRALRDGQLAEVPAVEIVPGDIVHLSAGSLVPADGLLLEAVDLNVNEAVLTGETFPAAKAPGVAPAGAGLAARTNCVFQGTSVRSGTARVLVVHTGRDTAYGAIADRLALGPPETEFDRGLRRFGYLITQAMSVLVVLVFAVNVLLERPVIDSLLFSIALAVGLAPELLPAILAVNLARSAQAMAHAGVLVRRLSAIENLGSMDVLCMDKTGTITEGAVVLDGAFDQHGRASDQVLRLAGLNASFQTGLVNPLDEAILTQVHAAALMADRTGVDKLCELPYDFVRRRLGIVIREQGRVQLITKGALESVLAVSSRSADGMLLDPAAREAIRGCAATWNQQGLRVLGVATRELPDRATYHREDEEDMCFVGYLVFSDPPKPHIERTVAELESLGVRLKIITGDVWQVARHVAERVGLPVARIVTGTQLDEMHDEALWRLAAEIDIFAEIDPNQKERIILALQKTGHVVGYLGDGINDAPALHAADVGISVDRAVDVAKEAAAMVLLEPDLSALRQGILAGRTTFANTLKYVLATTSANLGNMLSMAVAAIFLPFLPLLAGQILLNNFLSDIPALTLANDRVDAELVARPRRWDMALIRRFMLEFGPLSSVFDLFTFTTLLLVFHVDVELFRTAWFVESLLSELIVALIIRTRRRFYRSAPARSLVAATLAVAAVALVLPYLPHAHVLGFAPMPGSLLLTLLAITLLYAAAAELLKSFAYRHLERS